MYNLSYSETGEFVKKPWEFFIDDYLDFLGRRLYLPLCNCTTDESKEIPEQLLKEFAERQCQQALIIFNETEKISMPWECAAGKYLCFPDRNSCSAYEMCTRVQPVTGEQCVEIGCIHHHAIPEQCFSEQRWNCILPVPWVSHAYSFPELQVGEVSSHVTFPILGVPGATDNLSRGGGYACEQGLQQTTFLSGVATEIQVCDKSCVLAIEALLQNSNCTVKYSFPVSTKEGSQLNNIQIFQSTTTISISWTTTSRRTS